ncbi:glutamate racemase [Patescibacteria group bacterium]|nr:glutamate racemase [Patescibacteria group bacterium]
MIGLFDSGIGGLTVVRALQRLLPDVSLVYFGDTARTPYGNKSAQVVKGYGLEASKFLLEKGATVLVVACNTVSAVGIEEIRQTWPKVPIFEVISPVVEKIKLSNFKKVGIMGTRATINSQAYQTKLNQASIKVQACAAPLLVPLVEENYINTPATKRIVKNYLLPFKQAQVEALVLACTHYPLLKKIIRARLPKKMKILDPADETARVVVAWLKNNPNFSQKLNNNQSHYYVSDLTPHFQKVAEQWLGKKINLEKVDLIN